MTADCWTIDSSIYYISPKLSKMFLRVRHRLKYFHWHYFAYQLKISVYPGKTKSRLVPLYDVFKNFFSLLFYFFILPNMTKQWSEFKNAIGWFPSIQVSHVLT